MEATLTATEGRQPGARRGTVATGAATIAALVLALSGLLTGAGAGAAPQTTGGPLGPAAAAAAPDSVRILMGEAGSLDPAVQGDIGSAAVSAQLYEGLTAFDAQLQVRPALAASWDLLDGGRRIVFHLKPDLTFSDGTPLTGEDVVRSWLRIADPDAPSPLVSLIGDVEGALAYARGEAEPTDVGLTADGLDLEVRLVRPATDFVSIVASPTFAVVPAAIDDDPTGLLPGSFVGSGAYVLRAADGATTTLSANERYWAGPPAIPTIEMVHDIGGRSPVAAFEEGDLDLTDIFSFDATWIAFDAALGPQLRQGNSMSVNYYGFDTTRPPFDDVRVRQAFTRAVDWRRLVPLVAGETASLATSMVPPGIPGRSEEDFLPPYDPDGARELLADAGYPSGRGFPEISFRTFGGGYDAAVVAEVERELAIDVAYETMTGDYFGRLAIDPPNIWSMGWVADYPGPNDFLGILLGTGSSNNYGGWSSAAFDAAIADALETADPDEARAAFDRAEEIVRDEAPVVPLSYDVEWTLARTGLLGAHENGMGIVRMAGLAWDE
ncbi:MAG TPA: peptide ABC transporter substrate-binding protein [Candidatus Limnocylindrales bacterium]|nr:peptide ABC transporter substrate-binding protein [Candidatus Limnocylindrales bacterium]